VRSHPIPEREPGPGREPTMQRQSNNVNQPNAVRHPITLHWRQEQRTIQLEVPEGEYILRSFEEQGESLPFSCRNGCCTACAVRVIHGAIDQREALGLSRALRAQGYGLLCVARATGPLEVETQDEDEVYELQFGRHFGRGKVRPGIPLDDE
jgi:ferredoxin